MIDLRQQNVCHPCSSIIHLTNVLAQIVIKKIVSHIPFTDLGIVLFKGPSKELVRSLIADGFDVSGPAGLGKSFLMAGGGVERFLVLGFSKVEVNAAKAGDLPRRLR